MMKVTVIHDRYGCDTGCCGHVVECDEDRAFVFTHWKENRETAIEFAKRMVEEEFGKEHGLDLDWGNCEVRTIDGCG